LISRDINYLKQQAQENLTTHFQDKLPKEYPALFDWNKSNVEAKFGRS
jgi:hypothetical protein